MADGASVPGDVVLEECVRVARQNAMAAQFLASKLGEESLAEGLSLAAEILDGALDELRRRAT